MNAQLQSVTENSKTGQRLTVSLAANHGDIGSNAVDLSYSDGGATQEVLLVQRPLQWGINTTASGIIPLQWGNIQPPLVLRSTAMGAYTTASAIIPLQWGLQPPLAMFPLQWGAIQPPLILLP